MQQIEVTTAAEVVPTVHKHGFAIWRGLVAPSVTNQILVPTIRHMNNPEHYASVKYRVLKLNIVPADIAEALIPSEVVSVFDAALGAHAITIKEIYLAPPEQFKPHPWHQDANEKDNQTYHFMVWIAATPAGADAPGLSFAMGNPGEYLGGRLASEMVGREIVSPIFSPGDAVFFDLFSLHKTNFSPSMMCSRVAYKLGAKAK